MRNLQSGDHFGEVGFLIECPRSATVKSENYLTCSRINRESYYELIKFYPDFKALFLKDIHEYMDPVKIFLEVKLNRIPYFKDLPKKVKNEFMFSMEVENMEHG